MGRMYGDRRITLAKTGRVFHCGGKNSEQIGAYWHFEDGRWGAQILKVKHRFERSLTDKNSVDVFATSRDELRDKIGAIWLKA